RDEDFDASYESLVRLAAVVGDAKPRGTPAHLLAAMPAGFYKDFAVPGCETRCPICLDDYKDLDPVLRISDCDHWFHKECLQASTSAAHLISTYAHASINSNGSKALVRALSARAL
ncbi:hypothetical protein JB92DRAFT_2746837, partial [Gautieria morchelliformis]